jgi:peptidoglycan hydrolase CwlO-like protein
MTLSFIQLVSVAGAVITIVAILLVAAVIGYLTAWFYAKSVYKPIIKGLEEEKQNLQNQVAGLKEDITKLNGSIDELNEKVAKLEEEVKNKDEEIKGLKNK